MPQHGNIEYALVGLAVCPHQSRPIHGKENRQAREADIVDNLIVGPLQESGVDSHHGTIAGAGHSRGKGDGMLLGDAHIKEAAGESLGKLY